MVGEGRGRRDCLGAPSLSGDGSCISTVGWPAGPRTAGRYGAGGMQPVPPVSQWQAGLSGPPITWAVVSTTTRPAVASAWRKSRNALSSPGLIEYAPQWRPVLWSQTRWNTNCTQSVDWVSASAFSTYDSSVDSLVEVFGLGGV